MAGNKGIRSNKQYVNSVCMVIAILTLFLLMACGSYDTDQIQTLPPDNLEQGGGSAPVQDDVTVSEPEQESSLMLENLPDESDMFTGRDLRGDYDETESVFITLTGNSASCDADDSSVVITDHTVTIKTEGTYILSGNLEGMIVIDADDTDKIQLVLNGAEISNENNAAIYIKAADKVFVTLVDGTQNSLSAGNYITIDENNIDGVIFSKCDLTINGSGSLEILAEIGNGIVSKDDLVITGGTVTVTAPSGHGLEGKDSVRIADGSLYITAGKDGIHSDNDNNPEKGFVYIKGGTIQISAGDDGVHAETTAAVAGGRIDIVNAYEGIEGKNVVITGGEIRMNVTDDGLNAAGGNDDRGEGGFGGRDMFEGDDSTVMISGGILYIRAAGDGIDSNGDLIVTGGELYVSGPENGANGALDYSGTGQITGGILVAVGHRQMAMNFGDTSTQCSILVNVDDCQAGDKIQLGDASGNILVSYISESDFNSVVVSCPELKQGETYTLAAGNSITEITLDSVIYGNGMGMGGFNGGFGGPGGGHGPGGGYGSDGGHGPGGGFGPGGGYNSNDGESPDDGRNMLQEGGFDGRMQDGEIPEMPNGELPEIPDGEPPVR